MSDLNIQMENGGSICGRYGIRNLRSRQIREGRTFVNMLPEYTSASISGCLSDLQPALELSADTTCVQVCGQARIPSPEDLIRLIPQSLCPLPWLMPFLEVIISRIRNPALKRFTAEVFSDDSIALSFVSCPASLRYHHNYPGGLLRHSIECAQMIEHYEEFPVEKRELGILAALFHDIGKILTMTPTRPQATVEEAPQNDNLTLKVLSPYFRRLGKENPQLSAELRYLMTWRPGLKDTGVPCTPVAQTVFGADLISARRGIFIRSL